MYGFEKYRVNLDPISDISFGLSEDYLTSQPMGKTRIAFREETNECIFEQEISDLQHEGQRWLPYGRGSRGVTVIRVGHWEIWGFRQMPQGFPHFNQRAVRHSAPKLIKLP